ncbi:SMC-Scp complex subunit ScpB [Sphingobacterium rhinopitheci]|uniref:SMC-Scp complex subunit ScpB n=1 Tax=Sphingobacterium rhinopitheci TaxID=2781960 RepID=UPI001F5184A8|nr:SMC-Scp complex subunit ScpB [Sphingobacterium rhinopitheci]MCI0919958.1 SMC-Scp complex subunit ScpB [Sphingobacterium rhinopitheci]
MKDIQLNIEALIFSSEEGISAQEIKHVLQDGLLITINKDEVLVFIDSIKNKYESEDSVFSLKMINNKYQLLTKESYHDVINQLQAHRDRKKLSQSALETLAIIAYRQPITKLEVEQIRGVNCDYSIQRLLEKDLIKITGKAESIGKPLLYATSDQFMNHFGINSVKDLPQLKDIINEENSIGEIVE